jgi:hypothetical protein
VDPAAGADIPGPMVRDDRFQRQDVDAERGRIVAMRAAIRYARYAPSVHAVLVRTLAFILFGSALGALLPLVVRTEMKLGQSAYGQCTALLAPAH